MKTLSIGLLIGLFSISQIFAQSPAVLTGQVYFDSNSNGMMDANEAHVGRGFNVSLWYGIPSSLFHGAACAAKAFEIATDTEGRYSFTIPDDTGFYFMGDPCFSGTDFFNISDGTGARQFLGEAPGVRNLGILPDTFQGLQLFTVQGFVNVAAFSPSPDGTLVRLWRDTNGDDRVDTVVDETTVESRRYQFQIAELGDVYNVQMIKPDGFTGFYPLEDNVGAGGFTPSFRAEGFFQTFNFDARLEGNGGVKVTHFLDFNGDGVWDQREPLMTQIRTELYERTPQGVVKRGNLRPQDWGNATAAAFDASGTNPFYTKVYAPDGFAISPNANDNDHDASGRSGNFFLADTSEIGAGYTPVADGTQGNELVSVSVSPTDSFVDLYFTYSGVPNQNAPVEANIWAFDRQRFTLSGNQLLRPDGNLAGQVEIEQIGRTVHVSFPRELMTEVHGDFLDMIVTYEVSGVSRGTGRITIRTDQFPEDAIPGIWPSSALSIWDGDDLSAPYDVKRLRAQALDDRWYFLLEGDINDIPFQFENDGFLFVDTDQNSNTGYVVYGIGADIMVRGNQIFSYSGSGGNWGWTTIDLDLAVEANNYWRQISFQSLPGVRAIDFVVFHGSGQNSEVVRDNGNPASLTFAPPLTKTIDGDLSDWDIEDSLSDSAIDQSGQPYNATRVYFSLGAQDETNRVYIAYTNATPFQLTDDWFIFINETFVSFDQLGRLMERRRSFRGWRYGESLTAPFMVRGSHLFRHSGTPGSNVWQWEDLGEINDFAVSGNNVELVITLPGFSGRGTTVQFFATNPNGNREIVPDTYTGFSN